MGLRITGHALFMFAIHGLITHLGFMFGYISTNFGTRRTLFRGQLRFLISGIKPKLYAFSVHLAINTFLIKGETFLSNNKVLLIFLLLTLELSHLQLLIL
ncbi:MAG: hypothetical protein B7Z68_03500 [Acidobacteria bacterium 21-70-11]|nr:MAG: hypothetical protein B7Z68_03500 [Acidobacteria bacterium 21-70-11]